VGSIFTTATSYLFKVYVARILGAEQLGIYALGMTFVGFFGVFNALGLPQSAVRFVSAYMGSGQIEELRSFLFRGCGIVLAATTVLGCVMLFCAPSFSVRFYKAPVLAQYIWLFALIMATGTFTTFLGQILSGYKDVARRTFITNFVGGPLMMLVAVGLLLRGKGLGGYLAAQVISGIVVIFLLLASIWRLTPKPARKVTSRMAPLDRGVISFSFSVVIMDFFALVMSQGDKFVIGHYLNAREVGIYSLAAGLIVYVPVVLQSVNQIFAPMISDLHTRGQHSQLEEMYRILTKWIVALTVPLVLVISTFARPIMGIFGHEFEVGWPILVIGALGQLVNCGVGSAGYLLLMAGHQRSLLRIQAVMAIVMVLLSFVLVRDYGILGPALAAALVNGFTNLWLLFDVRRKLRISPYTPAYLKLLLPWAVTALVTLEWHSVAPASTPQWLIVVVALLLAYVVFLPLVGLLALEAFDRQIILGLLSQLRSVRLSKQKRLEGCSQASA
jgi:O-antigen/teichoic acid export membrane protein